MIARLWDGLSQRVLDLIIRFLLGPEMPIWPVRLQDQPVQRPQGTLPLVRRMQALATNDRRLSGAHCRGELVGPAVRMMG